MAATSVLARQASSASQTTTHMPLTTVFSPAASCAEKPYTFFSEVDGLSTFWHGADGNFSGTQEACFPSGYGYQHQPGVSAEYSPGVCPQGYAGAQVVQNGAVGAISSWCCPSGMTYAANYGCESLITTSTVLIVDSTENVTMTTPFLAVDWYIKVAWASSELDIFTPASAPVLAAVTSDASTSVVTSNSAASPDSAKSTPQDPSASQTLEPTPSPSPAKTSAPESSSLSTGAKAGIGVGVAVGVLIAAAVLFLWYRKRRQQVQPAAPNTGTKPELDGSQANLSANYGQVPQSEIFEADGVGRPPEADSGNVIAEMEGNWHGHELAPKAKR